MNKKKTHDRQSQVNDYLNGFNDYLIRHWDEFLKLLENEDLEGHEVEE